MTAKSNLERLADAEAEIKELRSQLAKFAGMALATHHRLSSLVNPLYEGPIKQASEPPHTEETAR